MIRGSKAKSEFKEKRDTAGHSFPGSRGAVKIALFVLIGMTLFFLYPPNTPCLAETRSIQIANGDWPPYFSSTLKHNGVVSRIVKEAFKKEGIIVEYVFRPWKRGLVEAKDGKWAGTVGWIKTAEREEVFLFTKPIMALRPVFFHRKNNPISWDTMADLKGIKIGATDGFFYGHEFEKAEAQKTIIVDRTIDAYHSLKKLINKRVDLAAIERNVGRYKLLTQIDKDQAVLIEPQEKVLHSKPAYLLISKKTQHAHEIALLFNRGLEKLVRSGTVDQYWKEFKQQDY